jgi:hypothetical protein
MFSFLRRPSAVRAAQRQTTNRFRPTFELLEDRCVPAQVWAVHSGLDDVNTHGTLRYGIAHAADGDTIRVAADVHTIVLTQGPLVLDKSLTVEALPDEAAPPAQARHAVVVSGGDDPRTLEVLAGLVENWGLDISGGNGVGTVPGYDGLGGAVLNFGDLTVHDCQIYGNYAQYEGGAIYNAAGAKLTINNCDVHDNFTTDLSSDGGAIANYGTLMINGGTMTSNFSAFGGAVANFGPLMMMTNVSTVSVSGDLATSGNGASVGGAIASGAGALFTFGSPPPAPPVITIIDNCTLDYNSVLLGTFGFAGGAIFNGANSTMTIKNGSRLDHNTAFGFVTTHRPNGYLGGGAILNAGSLEVDDSTLSGNRTSFSDGGGAIQNWATLTIHHGTLTDNHAEFAARGGGAIVNYFSGTVTIDNHSVLSLNGADDGNGGAILNVLGTVTINDSTLDSNMAGHDGGAIANFFGTVILNYSEVSGNTAGDVGGGIFSRHGMLVQSGNTFGSMDNIVELP